MWCYVISQQRWAWVIITTHVSSPVLLSQCSTKGNAVQSMCSIAPTVTHHRAVVTLCVLFPYRKLHGTLGPPLYERSTAKTKCRMAFTAQTYQMTGFWRWGHANLIQTQCYARATKSRFVFRLFYSLWGCLFAFKNISGSHKCLWSPEQNGIQVSWLSAVGRGRPTAQCVSQEGKQADRVGLVEGKKRLCYAREWVWPGGRHCCTQLLICPASQHKWPLVNHLPADRLSHDIPRAQASQRPSTDAGCRNRHNSGKVNCLKVKQASELVLRPDEVLKVCHRLMQVYFLWRVF